MGLIRVFRIADEFTAAFTVRTMLHGDVLIHLSWYQPDTGRRYSAFKMGMHTGFLPTSVFRVDKAKMDIAPGRTLDGRGKLK